MGVYHAVPAMRLVSEVLNTNKRRNASFYQDSVPAPGSHFSIVKWRSGMGIRNYERDVMFLLIYFEDGCLYKVT